MSKSKLEKRALRKKHNTKLRLQREQKSIMERRQNKEFRSVNDFAKAFVADIISLVQEKEYCTSYVHQTKNFIANLKQKDPTKYCDLSTDKLDAIETDLKSFTAKTDELGIVAGKIEDSTSALEKIKLLTENVDAITSAQEELENIISKLQTSFFDLDNVAKGAKAPDGEAMDTPAQTAVDFDEGRTSEDQEIELDATEVSEVVDDTTAS